MKKNDLFEIEITDMGAGGEGIGHYEGMTFFIKDAIIGDVILARITKLKTNYGYARVEEVKIPSEFRIEPPCPLHRKCGGCQIQAMAYPRQLEYKHNKVRENMIRIGGFSEELLDEVMQPPVGMEATVDVKPQELQETFGAYLEKARDTQETSSASVIDMQKTMLDGINAATYRYRNKAQFPVGMDSHGNVVMGFYATHSHDIIPVDDCLLGVEINQPILEIIKVWMKRYAIAPYDERTGKGIVRHVLIRYGFQSGQIMVCLVVNAKKIPYAQELTGELARIDGMKSISYNINQDNTNVILGKKTVCIWGQAYIEDSIRLWDCAVTYNENKADQAVPINKSQTGQMESINDNQIGQAASDKKYRGEYALGANGFRLTDKRITYHISPQSFYQVNPLQTEKLYSTALSYTGLTGKECVWDLYCGIGTISLFLAQRAKQVYGVEIVEQAIEDARANAKRNGITNAEFFVGKVEEILPNFYNKTRECLESGVNNEEGGEESVSIDEKTSMSSVNGAAEMSYPDVIVVDPPRKGCDVKCLETMLLMQPERIVYVSCDSATLARDLKVLCEGGYELRKARVFDQFPHTVHVETVVSLGNQKSRRKPDSYFNFELDMKDYYRITGRKPGI